MKVTRIVSSLVIASAAAAAAIPRQIDTSPLNPVIAKLDSVLANVEGAINGASLATRSVDLEDIHSQLTEIQGLLGAIPSSPGLTDKRTVLPTNPVNELVTGVKGSASSDVDSIASPVLSTRTPIDESNIARRVDLSALLPLAQQLVTDLQDNVAVSTVLGDVDSLIAEIPLLGIPDEVLSLTNLGLGGI